MAVRIFGAARPVTLQAIEPGVILLADDHNGKRLIGIGVEDDHGPLFVVLWSAGDISAPYVLEPSDVHRSVSVIDGDLELEAVEPFKALLDRTLRNDGLFVTADKQIGVAVSMPGYSGRTDQRRHFRLSDGRKMTENGGAHALLGPVNAYVRYEGRQDRVPLWIAET